MNNTVSDGGNVEAKTREVIVEWFKSLLPGLSLSVNASDDDLRACLVDGTVLCRILAKLKPGFAGESVYSAEPRYDKLKRVLAALHEMGVPKFDIHDLETGSMKTILESLSVLRSQSMPIIRGNGFPKIDPISKTSSEERRKILNDSKFERAMRSPVAPEPSAALLHHGGHKFHEVFQHKHGRYADIPAAKISEMEKSNSLDNAPTQSLLSVVNGILDESIERKNGEIPQRFACLLRKVVLEIERRISTQAEHLRTQNNVFKAREEKYQSRIKVLEALASGTTDETQIVMKQLQRIESDKTKMEETKKLEEQDMERLIKEKDRHYLEISSLKQEMEIARNTHELRCKQIETEAKGVKVELEIKVKELERLLSNSKNKVQELEAKSESKHETWNKKEHTYQKLVDFQFGVLKDLRLTSQSIKEEVSATEKSYMKEFKSLGLKLKILSDAAENYHSLLAENRKLFNEVQDLKGNIRVYCRIRPFLRGQNGKLTTIDSIGENGDLVVANPSKPGKDGQRSFKFNEVYGPTATQEKVYSDTQPLIRSILDGYNVCIFAYGQTGSGKTYTMIGPNGATEADWGVNYRALNDLFKISQARRSSFQYEIGVQMVEIYNEQVRDLLCSDSTQKKLSILTTPQPNGLTVPDASMLPVKSTTDVLELMATGLKNRAVGATAMNERSSRSHSVVTIHVSGTDLKTEASLRGSLHLVDLAGSERVDRSEVTGDRLKEAQFINKSLSALGDVIFALAQKSSHVPYRNSKLTQVLQSSLGGQAKTLMFVQLNPDTNSYSETMSTLTFAERVSGVELGAARSSKEGKDLRYLMEQVASLKDTISRKDEEIERLQLLKDHKNVLPGVNGEKRSTSSLRYGSPSPPSRTENGSLRKSKLVGARNSPEDAAEILTTSSSGGVVPDYEDKLSDKSDGSGLSVETETDGSVDSFQESHFASDKLQRTKSTTRLPRRSSKETLRVPRSLGKAASSSSLAKPAKRWA